MLLAKKIIAVILIFTLSNIVTAQVKKIRIDPVNAMGGAASKYFSEVEFIPLETTKESLFGKIDKLEITDKYFIIQDKATDAILFFNRNGKFHHKITKLTFDKTVKIVSNPLYPMGSILTFTVNAEKELLYIRALADRQFLYVFNFQGDRLAKMTLPVYASDYFILKGGGFYYRQMRPDVKERESFLPNDLFYQQDTSATLQPLFPVDFAKAPGKTDIPGHISYLHGFTGDSICMYTPDIDYNIYELNKSGIKDQYQILFPQQVALPVNFATDTNYYHKWNRYMEEHKIIGGILEAYRTGNNLVFCFAMPVSDYARAGFYHMIYNLKSSRLVSLKNITPDNKTYQFSINNPLRSNILACGGDHNIFFSYPSLAMFDMLNAMGEKHSAFDPRLDNYFKTQSRKSNPVILRLKLKSDL